ncbi:plexin-C1-like [Clupea harengus]|uniref:Plexin-C1-like n=1 Tax=Clupea harengus TaxID=7950 RepID=A0A6P8GJP5_CLUHA|nr:plexin-C1-like [Clupea harengus]
MNVKNRFESKVKLLTLDNRNSKGETFKTLQGAALQCCDGNESWMLLSSALIPGESQVLWAGVFQDNTGDAAVAIFDISPSQTGPVSGFCFNKDECNEEDKRQSDLVKDKVLKPAAVVFKYSNITSVAALRSNSWIVLFFGTGTGLLIKLVVDASLKPGCPTVLYSSNEDQHILPRMLFTPVHHTDIYIALGNQMIRVPVAQCGVYQTLRDCWSALDPFCGWCVSQSRCSFQHDCSSSDWVSVPGTSLQREIISVHMKRSTNGQDITVTAAPNLNIGIHFSCALEKCDSPGPSSCSCILSSESFPAEGLSLSVLITIQRETLIKDVLLENCSAIRGGPPSVLSPVLSYSGNSPSVELLTFHIPSGTKSTVRVCVLTPDSQCHGNAKLTYASQPTCRGLSPNTTWASGGREILFAGSNLEFVEKVKHGGSSEEILISLQTREIFFFFQKLGYFTPPGLSDSPMPMQESVMLIVGNYSVTCKGKLTYHPDPHFTSFTTIPTGKDMSVVIQKTADSLVLKQEEISVQAMQGEKSYGCVIERIEPSADTTAVVCVISNQTGLSIDTLKITVGGSLSVSLKKSQNLSYPITIFIAFTICVVVVVVVYLDREKQRMPMNQNAPEQLEMSEYDDIGNEYDYICQEYDDISQEYDDISQEYDDIGPEYVVIDDDNDDKDDTGNDYDEIGQGFVEMRTERSDIISSTGAIPFLDYKHFASRIFFPEGGPLATSMRKDMTQLSVKEQQEQSCKALSHLIRDPLFLVSFIHTLEEQKNFTDKDK